MLSSGAPLTKTLPLAPQKATPPARNFVGLTLKEYFNIDHAPLAHIDEENQSESEADAATPSFPNPRHTRERPRRTRHKTELEDIVREEKQSLPKPTHRIATLSLQDIEKSVVKLPAIHDQRQSKAQRGEGRRMDESSSINLAIFLRKSGKEGKGSVGKSGMNNVRRGMRSRVTSTSFYHMNVRDRTKTEDDGEGGLQKSFVITRYGALKGVRKVTEDAALQKYENSFKLSKQ